MCQCQQIFFGGEDYSHWCEATQRYHSVDATFEQCPKSRVDPIAILLKHEALFSPPVLIFFYHLKQRMDVRVLIFLVIVSSCWCSYARHLAANHFTGESALISDLWSLEDSQHIEEFRKNEDPCTLCKKLASDALKYLAENKTQTEIISILHQACNKIHTFKKECIVLVNLYAPLLLSEVSSMKPTDLCQKVDLCKKNMSVSQYVSKDKCDLCHSVITEALEKLKDPDTELPDS